MSPSKDRVLQAKSKNDRSEQQSPKLSVTIIPTLEIHALAQALQLPLQKLQTNTSLQIISSPIKKFLALHLQLEIYRARAHSSKVTIYQWKIRIGNLYHSPQKLHVRLKTVSLTLAAQ